MTKKNIQEMKDSTKQQESGEPVSTGNPHAKRSADKTSGKEPMPTLPGTKAEQISYLTKYFAGLSPGTMESLWNSLVSKHDAIEFGGGQSGNEGNAKTITAHKVAKEDIEDLFKSLDVSPEFIEKAAVIFESALNIRMTEAEAELEEAYEEALDEAIGEFIEESNSTISEYLKVLSEDFVAKNELAVASSVRADLAESFLTGFKQLLEDHYVVLPEDKRDIYEEAVADAADLETKLNEAIEEKLVMAKEIEGFKRKEIVATMSEGLTLSDKEKLVKLTESVEYDSLKAFETKVKILKESNFPKTGDKKTLNENSLNGGEPLVQPKDEKTSSSPEMKSFVEAFKRLNTTY